MRAKEFITELFNTPIVYKQSALKQKYSGEPVEGINRIEGEFTVNDNEYKMTAIFGKAEKMAPTHFMHFNAVEEDIMISFGFKNISVPEDKKFAVTGTGNQFKIFSTMIQFMETVVDIVDPKIILFEARSPQREKLYRKIIEHQKTNWTFTQKFGYYIGKK